MKFRVEPPSIFLTSFLKICCWSVVFSAFYCGIPVQTRAQDASADRYDSILKSIREAEYVPAERAIDRLLAENGDDHKAHMLRKALANSLARAGKRDLAEVQFRRFLDYLISGREQSRPLLRQLPQVLVNLRYLRENQEPQASRTLEKIVKVMNQAVAAEPNNVAFSTGLSTAINFSARGLQKRGDYAAVQTIYSKEIDRLRKLWRDRNESPNNWLRLIYFLKTASSPKHPTYQAFASELIQERKNLLQLAISRFPQSTDVVLEYVNDQMAELELLQKQSPQAALPLLLKLQNQVNNIIGQSSSPEAIVGSKLTVDKATQRLQRQMNRDSLVGSPLPALHDVRWLKGDESAVDFPAPQPVAIVFASPNDQESLNAIKKIGELLQQQELKCDLAIVFNDFDQSFLRFTSARRKGSPGDDEKRIAFRENLLSDVIQGEGRTGYVGVASKSTQLAIRFGIDKLPFLLLADKDGVCRYMNSGPIEFGKFVLATQNIDKEQDR